MEAYVDNIIVKSDKVKEHINNLEKVCNVLRKFKVKLNSKKCIFGVAVGKFFGFMVSYRDIKAHFKKIKSIIEMKPSISVKTVQRLISRVAALNIFISRVVDICLPFFKLLRKIYNFERIEEH